MSHQVLDHVAELIQIKAAITAMASMDHKATEPCVQKRLVSALQTTDIILCGDMIDGAIEIARRKREEVSGSGPTFDKSCA